MASVIEDNPLFVAGYYLSQKAAGQPVDSNAVDGGSVMAKDTDVSDRTTRTDGVPDKSQVDMGYHYERGAPQYCLSVTVLPDASGQIHGGVTPKDGSYMAGTALVLKANPDPGYVLAGWYDANDTLLSVRSQYQLVMDANEVLRVRFRVPQKLSVSGGGNALQQAVNQAENGDTLVIAPGVYDGSIDLAGKAIRLVSTNPDDPTITAQTIIDCRGRSRGLIFNHGEGPDTVISGLTIRNGGCGRGGRRRHLHRPRLRSDLRESRDQQLYRAGVRRRRHLHGPR